MSQASIFEEFHDMITITSVLYGFSFGIGLLFLSYAVVNVGSRYGFSRHAHTLPADYIVAMARRSHETSSRGNRGRIVRSKNFSITQTFFILGTDLKVYSGTHEFVVGRKHFDAFPQPVLLSYDKNDFSKIMTTTDVNSTSLKAAAVGLAICVLTTLVSGSFKGTTSLMMMLIIGVCVSLIGNLLLLIFNGYAASYDSVTVTVRAERSIEEAVEAARSKAEVFTGEPLDMVIETGSGGMRFAPLMPSVDSP